MLDVPIEQVLGEFDSWTEDEAKIKDLASQQKVLKKDLRNRQKEYAKSLETTAEAISGSYSHFKAVKDKGPDPSQEDMYNLIAFIDAALEQERTEMEDETDQRDHDNRMTQAADEAVASLESQQRLAADSAK